MAWAGIGMPRCGGRQTAGHKLRRSTVTSDSFGEPAVRVRDQGDFATPAFDTAHFSNLNLEQLRSHSSIRDVTVFESPSVRFHDSRR